MEKEKEKEKFQKVNEVCEHFLSFVSSMILVANSLQDI